MVQSSSSGIQFASLFKIDKKLMTSSLAYILLNKEKKVQGISASSMSLMNLDIHSVKKLSLSGLEINVLAPDLFDSDVDSAYLTKQGSPIDWRVPDFEKKKRGNHNTLNY